MHRTTADDYVTIGSLPNQHIDQNLPGTPGTALSGEFANAVQEEIINVIQQAGISIETDPVTDRSNGFIQLKEAIFDSQALDTSAIKNGAIYDSKISNVSLSKFVDGVTNIEKSAGGFTDIFHIEVDGPIYKKRKPVAADYPFERNIAYSSYIEISEFISGTEYERAKLNKGQLLLEDKTNAIYDDYRSEYEIETLKFWRQRSDATIDNFASIDVANGFYNSRYGTSVTPEDASLKYDGLMFIDSYKRIKHKCIAFSNSGWAGTGPYSKEYDTGLTNSNTILAVFFTARRSSDDDIHTIGTTSPDFLENIYLRFSATYFVNVTINPNPASYENMYVTIIYSNG